MPALRRLAALLLTAVALCLAAPAAWAQDEGDDEPDYDVPAWAEDAKQLVDDEEWDDALHALAALAPSHGNAFALHYLTAEAWLGKRADASGAAGRRRALTAARASFTRAQALAPATMRTLMGHRLRMVNQELARLGAPAARRRAAPAPAEPTGEPAGGLAAAGEVAP